MTELSPSVLRKRNSTGSGTAAPSGASSAPSELTRIVRKMARELAPSMRGEKPPNWAGLYTLDSCVERSKEVLRDQHNSIEFYRGATGYAANDDDDDDEEHLGRSFIHDSSSDSSDFE